MAEPIKFVSFADLRAEYGIPYTRRHVDRLEKDGKFPKRTKLNGKSVVWTANQIAEWQAGQIS